MIHLVWLSRHKVECYRLLFTNSYNFVSTQRQEVKNVPVNKWGWRLAKRLLLKRIFLVDRAPRKSRTAPWSEDPRQWMVHGWAAARVKRWLTGSGTKHLRARHASHEPQTVWPWTLVFWNALSSSALFSKAMSMANQVSKGVFKYLSRWWCRILTEISLESWKLHWKLVTSSTACWD